LEHQKNIDKAREEAVKKLRDANRTEIGVAELAHEILSGSRSALGKGLTWVESNHPVIYEKGKQLVNRLLTHSETSIRIGITGVPGVGKSTFIESFGNHLVNNGHSVAVLAIDPSSQKTHGSILGDKTRMEKLASNPKAFIRPTPSADALGGVARSTRESIILCEAAGFDIVIIETVGVGQSEVAVHSMTDFFLLLMLAGAGDELQGIKRGIMEMADAIAITKADGDNLQKSKQAMAAFKNALHLFPESEYGWIPRVSICSALQNSGIDEVWKTISEHHRHLIVKNLLKAKRAEQDIYWFNTTLNQLWLKRMWNAPGALEEKSKLDVVIRSGKKSPFIAADEFLANLLKTNP
jgi:LAO/AO transport system kinase